MSTRSIIAVKDGEKYNAVYCHWDGYVSHNGKILFEDYTSYEYAKDLISLGAMSALNEAGEPHNKVEDMRYVFRNEEHMIDEFMKGLSTTEYLYYHDGEKWFVMGKLETGELDRDGCFIQEFGSRELEKQLPISLLAEELFEMSQKKIAY